MRSKGTAQSPGVRRPLQQRSQASLERMLDAAEEAFSTRGFAGARLVDIASTAGLTVGALYARFADKQALFDATYERFRQAALTRMTAYFEKAEDSGTAPREVIRAFVIGTGRNFAKSQGLFRALVELSAENPDVWQRMIATRDDAARVMCGYLRRAAGKGDAADLDGAAATAQQMMYGFFVIAMLNRKSLVRLDDETGVARLADAVCHTLGLDGGKVTSASRGKPRKSWALKSNRS